MTTVPKIRGTVYVFCYCEQWQGGGCECGQCRPAFADIAHALYLQPTEDRDNADAFVFLTGHTETGFLVEVGWRGRTQRGLPRVRFGDHSSYEEWQYDGGTLSLEYASSVSAGVRQPPLVARTHGAVQRVVVEPAAVGRGLSDPDT